MMIWFRQFDHFAKFGRLAGLALANHFGGRLKQADDLALGMGVTGEDARFGLPHHLLHQRHLLLDLAAQPLKHDLPSMSAACLTPLPICVAKRLACPTTRLVVSSKLR